MLQLGASSGIEREDIYVEELLNILPFSNKISVDGDVQKIELLNKELQKTEAYSDDKATPNLFSSNHNSALIQRNLELAYLEMNKKILNAMSLSKIETTLIDYAVKVSTRTIKHGKDSALEKLEFKGETLENYANIFYEYFKFKFIKPISISIFYSDFFIGFECKASDVETQSIKWIEKDIFKIYAKLSFTESSRDLFIQKDIKGYSKDSFFVIKPNEYKCWHAAVAYLDAYEINESIQGRKN
jgi:hypothetical protein